MYRVDDDGEHHHAIAESERQAAEYVFKYISTAGDVDEYMRDYSPRFTLMGPTETLSVTDEDGSKKTLTVAEWIEGEGAGLVCSSVF